ncbi:MAG TPA: ATP-binding protein [Acidimicrobiales bacterium]|nr:ATP-binding protein [Acidimicrobiales bacterium]
MSRPVHRATTANLCALYPFLAGSGLACDAVYIGADDAERAFCFDPWLLYPGVLTNPNILVAGQIGRGKSALVKTLVWRELVFGHRAAILDPKGEYAGLAAAAGVEPLRLAPGSGVRLNPLDPGPGADELPPTEIARRRLSLVQSIASAALGRDLAPIEKAACQLAMASLTSSCPTLPELARALLEPSEAAAAQIRTTAAELAKASHDVALEVRRLCEGDLAGLFDGPSTVAVDWDGPLVVLDLSALASEESLGILMACATAWIHAAVARPGAGQRFLVLDEAWRLLSHLGTARWLRASLKLSRQWGLSNIVVLHRLSDLVAAGDAGSEQRALAEGLLSDTETRVIYAQADGEVAPAAELLGLSAADRQRIPQLERGWALWKVGRSTHLVEHHLSAFEADFIVDTDAAMAQASAEVAS